MRTCRCGGGRAPPIAGHSGDGAARGQRRSFPPLPLFLLLRRRLPDLAPFRQHVSYAADLVLVLRTKVSQRSADVAMHLALIDARLDVDVVVGKPAATEEQAL